MVKFCRFCSAILLLALAAATASAKYFGVNVTKYFAVLCMHLMLPLHWSQFQIVTKFDVIICVRCSVTSVVSWRHGPSARDQPKQHDRHMPQEMLFVSRHGIFPPYVNLLSITDHVLHSRLLEKMMLIELATCRTQHQKLKVLEMYTVENYKLSKTNQVC